ncbi:Cytochrome P450 89A2 [Apostasia shenzhenica]|uniref:Cytochrome P450 89A2 n=1 Tax=Apostasia shenzhenica TaxID=1088818 RepID=A0A2I0AYQ3_9ASPA|nr:Cytochrome P450 89A2 [Apostasia shenzhenica]
MDWRLPFIVFLFLFIFFLLKQLHLPHLAAKRPKPPLPPVASPLPFLSLFCNHGFSLSKLELLLRRFHSFLGPILTLRLLPFAPPVIFISGASAAHDALIQQGDAFAGRPPAVEPFIFLTAGSRDISFADYGPLWRLLRGNLFRVLHPSRLHLFAPARRCALLFLLRKLQSQSPDGSGIILPKESFRRALFNLHISMCFGEKLKEREIREIESLQLFLLSLFTTFNVFAVLPAVAKLLYHKRWKKIVDARKRQAAIFLSLIKRRRKHEDYHRKGVNYCYVDSLLDLRLPEEEGRWLLINEAVNLCHEFLSGVETTTTVLEWTMAELAKHQEVQRKLLKEIKSIVAGDEDLLEEEQLKKMSYLKAVVLEALRRHPPSHFLLPHSVRDDVVLNGYLIPRGTEVRFSVANMNWDEKIWEDPMDFRPERFMAGGEGEGVDVTGKKEIKMMTFGAGKRMCPGQGLAMLHVEFMVANLVREFEWKEAEGEKVDLSEKLEFTIVMKNPLRVLISPRKRNSDEEEEEEEEDEEKRKKKKEILSSGEQMRVRVPLG